MSTSAIKAVFEQVIPEFEADAALARTIHSLVMGFINRNKDHIEFFGGNLTGAHVVRFVKADSNRWFDDVLDADEEELREKLHALPSPPGSKQGPLLLSSDNGPFLVAGDPLNLSAVWVMHKFYTNTGMPVAKRLEAIHDVLMYLQFKFLTSRLFRHFQYPLDPAVAEATYAQLTNKFSIKAMGSWIAVLNNRATDVSINSSIHFNAIARMDDDERVTRMLSDIQGRLRDMLKNIYNVTKMVKEQGGRISTTSAVAEFDGVESLKDNTRGLAVYTRYIRQVVSDRNSFIRDELLRVVDDVMVSAPPKHVRAALEYISNNCTKSASDRIDDLLESTMVHSYAYLAQNRAAVRANMDLAGLLLRLRGVYTSSRSTDPDLLDLRKSMEGVVRKAIDSRTESVIASVRTAVLLYIVARAYTMRHYSSSSSFS